MNAPNEKAAGASPSFFNRRFIFLFATTFLAYANISVFFQFYAYLQTLPIDPKRFGLIIGIFSAVSLAVRPFISPFFHTANARRYLFIGTAAAIATLAAYSLTGGFWSLMLVRSLHGLAFVILGTALMAVTVDHIPEGKSAQFFGLLAVVILIPNTLIPPILPFLHRSLGGFTRVLLLFAGITVLVFPLIASFSPKGSRKDAAARPRRLQGEEIRADLKDIRILLLLSAMLLFYSGHALVFFFLDGYGRHIGMTGTGFFLTLTTMGEIGVRLAAGSLFDRTNKFHTLAATLAGLFLGYVALAYARTPFVFFAVGGVLGLGWGIAMPVFNGLMFDLSAAKLRAFNTNLGMQMFQAGFFLGPMVGGYVVAHGGFSVLFTVCAGFSLLSAGLILCLKRRAR